MKLTRSLLTLTAASSFILAGGSVADAHASDLLSSPLLRIGLTRSQIARVQAAQTRGKSINFDLIESVSCARHNDCEAVGIKLIYKFTSNVTVTSTMTGYAERWNGTEWSVQRTVNPTDNTELRSVSCYAPDRCIAVGVFEDHAKNLNRDLPLTERWNGVRWSQIAIGAPKSKKSSSVLMAVSCVRTGQCTAVGNVENSRYSAITSYTERFDGARWSRLPSPKTPLGLDVSCPASGDCFALDLIGSRISHEQNGLWTSQSVPAPTQATSVYFDSLSCGSVYDCVAAGTYETYAKVRREWITLPVVEYYDGIGWSRMLLPKTVYSPFGEYFPNVSCSSSGNCLAVGFGVKGGYPTLVLQDGSWRRVTTYRNAQGAISCPDSNYCVATSNFISGFGAIKHPSQSAIFNGLCWRTMKMPLPRFSL